MISLVKPDTFKISAKHTKTNIYGMAFILKITRKNAVGSALLAEIFNNGSRAFKGPVEMNTRLNNMDGAVFNAGCVKKGDNICLCVSLECLKSVPDHTAEGFIDDIIFKPQLNGEAFDTFVFKKAYEALKERILCRRDSKKSYAMDRCIEEMYGGDGFGIPEDGFIEDLEGYTAEELFRLYDRAILSGQHIEKGITGDVTQENIPCTKGVKDIDEDMDTEQGRLCLGFTAEGAEYIPLLLLNEILGGNAGSRLFNTVRERENLCYYVNSTAFRLKSIITVQAGIEKEAKDKAAELIVKAVEDIKNNITAEDVKRAKESVRNILLSKQERLYGLMDNIIDRVIGGEDLDEMLKQADTVSVKDTVKAAECLKLNTKYFLA